MNLFEWISERPILFLRYIIYALLAGGFLVTILINKHKKTKDKKQTVTDYRIVPETKDYDTGLPTKSVTLFYKNANSGFEAKIKTLLNNFQVKDYKNGFCSISSFNLHRLVENKNLSELNALAEECDELVCFVSHSTVGLYGFFHYKNEKCLRGYMSLAESGEVLHDIGNISDVETELGLYFPPCSEDFTEEGFDEITHEALEQILQLTISPETSNIIYDKEHIIEQYEKSCKIMYDATLNGDYKKNNKEGAKLIKIFKYFEQNRELAYECTSEMFHSENVVVRTKAAAYCLALNERTELAEKVLEEIANEPSNGIFGFNAEMTLKVWKDQGFLKLY